MSLLTVTSSGGACEKVVGVREDEEQVGSGHVGRTGAVLGGREEVEVLEEARCAAQKVWPQWRVTGAWSRAGGEQRGQ